MRRTNTCGELTKKNVGKKVVLDGWTQSRRDHGGLIFIDLRDRHGLTQIVFDPSHNKETHKMAEHIGREFVLEINGKIRDRKTGMINPNMKTGEIEVLVDELSILNKSETPPIEIDDNKEANEETRLKYRYLDLRRPAMQKRIALRHKIVTTARDYFNKHDFIEITTPMLVKSTPEGARDYVVPSRVNPGDFYALPQSPQLYKQLLMIAGFDRYYQTAICLRDEDLRADRQPEHMQFDFEMSFVTGDDIREFVEGLYKHLFKEVLNIKLDKFPVLSYKESMERFGTDKPDIRFGLELTDITDIAKKSDFSVFKSAETVKCINPEKDLSRKELDNYIDFCQKNGAKGMAWMRVSAKGLESSVVKYFSDNIQKELLKKTNAKPGSILMFIADKKKKAFEVLNLLRIKLKDDLNLVKENDFKFCWVNDFPLFAWSETGERWEPEHHMFTNPKKEFVKDFEKRPGEVIGDLWDLVLNGTEVGSGSIRISSPELQERIMRFIGMSKEEANKKFGFLLEAYKYGGPVHGGMGLGLDRTVALMAGLNDIREIIAFPKNKSAQCPMDGSPSDVDEIQLKELHIKSTFLKKKK
ncbi:aspartate--tRNA ligase [Candidatus Woesearchaeota archaeon CG_4_10_14_0_2_um_filter_33_10]|nr:MAG: aspartate--tRNA ligase [Candidatus Woesearchaeota archaeon CG1_02_33_12]PIN79007.1 MAG: aspartate--tRNA ligase [Candidatus Woesearchaeota archaeon CG10_big_fil_rev_8_21_14_0_10_33_12]PIZ52381.1 MAG: aspartate--tRNA ligase [Candidatus Woesearchaeota archaeon CG_4_10_14_0_2_um_filter_33_10]